MNIQRRHMAGAAAAIGATAIAGPGAVLAQAADQAALAQAVDALNKAMVDVDRSKLDALSAPELSYGHSAGRIETKAQFIDYLASRASAFKFINTTEQTIGMAGNAGIVRHLMTAETVTPAGQVSPVRIGVLQVWQKQGADWRLLARQAYRL